MDDVIVCQCGARMRRPAQASPTGFRCPLCHRMFSATPAPAPALSATASAPPAPPPLPPPTHPVATARLIAPPPLPAAAAPAPVPVRPKAPTPAPPSPAAVGAMCPTCQTVIVADDDCVSCPGCGQDHHRECWEEVGGCAIYGCRHAPVLNKDPSAGTEPALSAWGDTKNCPVCGEKIKAIAVACRYCGTDFGTVDPLTATDLHARHETEQSLKSMRASVITLFAVSILGLLAPIMLIVALAWVLPKRKMLARAGPVYLILGYGALGLSALYSFLMLVFLIAS